MPNDGEIDYDGFKKRGFLRSKEDGFFIFRARMICGNFKAEQLVKIADIASRYARGMVHMTVRQGVEVPFIRLNDIENVEKEAREAGILTGTSGPRLRAVTVCPGNNWCKSGLVNTFKLAERLENERGISSGMELPHKFKIVISGCPNTCTRAQCSEIGVTGAVDISGNKKIGFAVYLAGSGGRMTKIGFKLDKIYSEDEVLDLIEIIVKFFKDNAEPRQRLGALIEKIGKDNFLKAVGITV
ncbi:nitrite and sulfite reductase 4Fe-4S region [Candidatus Omnitrophus magneticus]|uniref:Nitrite and sulfite reductase 4Fe-4S region n=1 Tax=Candidatus Omnitrophus magneticus TaxID=1609969 RepID=A0A0F0CLN3_9BACT|nr:nitrite and sulfite reductase 4Fe-4S region [Candidatus Omnitrophus magneticus]